MNLLAQLQSQRTALKAEGKGILATAEAAGDYTQEQLDRLDAITESIEGTSGIDRKIAVEDRRRAEEMTAPAVAVDGPAAASTEEPKPFANLGEFMQAVRRSSGAGSPVHPGLRAIQEHAERQAAATGANETVGSDGGFLVQKDLNNELLALVHETGVLQQKARTIQIGPNSNGIKLNVIDETSRATGSRFGGVRGYWLAEAETKTASRPKFRQLEMTLQKLAGVFYATDELLQDSTALNSVATTAFTEEFGFLVDDAMVRGTGAGQPLGILNSPALVSVAKETGQAADTLLAENVWAMYARMAPRSLSGAEWYLNAGLWPQVFQLHQVIGTGGVPLYQPAGGLSVAPFGTLLGRPITPIEHASAPGDVGDILFADWSEYLIIEKGGVQTDSSIHVAFLTDESVFRWVLRINGQPRPSDPMTPYKGSATLSPFVTLDAR